jgi:hypothetical protein
MRVLIVLFLPLLLQASVPTTIDDFLLQGSQPGESGQVNQANRCGNCHGGYDEAVEPEFLWQGSMMAQAMRDPIYLACLTVANQDAPDVGDLCIRCHSPGGWLEGRSTPTDGSALTAADRESVHCEVCHRMVPVQLPGENPYPGDADYEADAWELDQVYVGSIGMLPAHAADGMFMVDDNDTKRGPYVDADARHQFAVSPYARDSAMCGTCHDVSNPVYERQPDGSYLPNDFGEPAPTASPYDHFPIERAFSEWLMSAYNSEEGVYDPRYSENKDFVASCQDCHMRDVTGVGANKNGLIIRSDLGQHDFTGGNTVAGRWAAALFPDEVPLAAIDSAVVRARRMLGLAATLDLDVENDQLRVRVTNESGHKLPSGYPEGRRMWLQIIMRDANDELLFSSGDYDLETAWLNHDEWLKIYEIKPGVSHTLSPVLNLPVGPSFHFVLNDTVWFDNRIPPRGFSNANFEAIQSAPRGESVLYADGQYWDDTHYPMPAGVTQVEARLLYQTISREYVEFLRDANVTDDRGDELYNLWSTTGMAPPELMVAASLNVSLPLEPPMLRITGTEDGWLLSWDPVAGATSYRIWQRTRTEGWQELVVISGQEWLLPELLVPDLKLFRVQAISN